MRGPRQWLTIRCPIDGADLQELFQGDDGVKILGEKVLNQVLQAQAGEQLQAGPYERTAERQGYRNGTRSRKLATWVGTLTLRIPQVREGQFSTDLFARYQRSEQALALMEMVINGGCIRWVRSSGGAWQCRDPGLPCPLRLYAHGRVVRGRRG